MTFDPNTDKIAITIPKFSLLKNSDGIFQKYNEPFIVSFAIDALGHNSPKIDFSFMPFPKIAKGGIVTMLGDGHLIYGPQNPGDFVAVSVLIMERDEDIRDLTRILGNSFDNVILYQDQCQRGREDGEVLKLLQEGLVGTKKAKQVKEVTGEFLAIDTALNDLSAGDICLILIDQVEESLAYLKEKVQP